MARYVKGFTYTPKIEGVKNGTITQTIRRLTNIKPGDTILFHGWKGKPYKSKWDWRLRVVIISVNKGEMRKNGFYSYPKFYDWDGAEIAEIARLDGINPPTGRELKRVLEQFYNEGAELDIITWRPLWLIEPNNPPKFFNVV